MSGERITVAARNGDASIFPKDYLGSGFQAYIAACKRAGARYDKESKTQLVKTDRVGLAVRALEEAGFTVEIEDELRDAVELSTLDVDKSTLDIDAMIHDLASRDLHPYPFQIEGIRWMASKKRGLMADEMGLGKTVQSLLAAPRTSPILVICPASLKANWRKEARRWRPDLTIRILKGERSFRWPAACRKGAERPEMVICNWDILPPVEDAEYTLQGAPEGVVVIADEAQAVKNNKGRRVIVKGIQKNLAPLRTLRFRALCKQARSADGWLWPMTGTPIENQPMDLWNILQSVGLANETFGSWGGFLKAFGGYRGTYGLKFGGPTEAVPRLLRATMLRRKRTQVLPDLPVKTWQYREVSIDSETRAICDEVQRQLLVSGIDLRKALCDVDASRLLVDFESNSRARAALATAKIPALMGIVDEYEDAQEPLVVWSYHRAPVEVLEGREGWAVIHGDTNARDRDQAVTAFQAGKLKGIALTIKAGGTGLTLTHAAHEIFVDLAWTPSANAQAEDRLCRIGQTRGVQVIRMVADHLVDERVTALLAKKQDLIDRSIDAATTEGAGEKTGGRTYLAPTSKTTPVPHTDKSADPGHPLPRFRPPSCELEEWSIGTLSYVADQDPDHATELNGVGFSRNDNLIGHSLVKQFGASGELSHKQWALVIKLANRYRRQASTPRPEGESDGRKGI